MDVKREKKSKLSTEITAGANWQTGNTEIIRISASANAAIIDSVKEFSFNMRYIYGENKKKKNQNEFSTGLQFDYRPLNRFSPFVRAELYSNEFKKISYRFSGLAGAKYRYFIKKKSNETVCDYSISGAVVYEYERYTREAGIQPKERFRLSVRPKFKQRLWKNTVFALECYYKPNIIDFSDCIVLSIVQLNFKLNKYLFVRCSYEWEYNNKPAAKALKKTDTLLMFNLGVNF
ncbi:MAG: DUF481 domain-containing protein [Prevotellaceae bacterium]|nr:DUF481 domain-containing protein [Prevotellaceae bacterium]